MKPVHKSKPVKTGIGLERKRPRVRSLRENAKRLFFALTRSWQARTLALQSFDLCTGFNYPLSTIFTHYSLLITHYLKELITKEELIT